MPEPPDDQPQPPERRPLHRPDDLATVLRDAEIPYGSVPGEELTQARDIDQRLRRRDRF